MERSEECVKSVQNEQYTKNNEQRQWRHSDTFIVNFE